LILDVFSGKSQLMVSTAAFICRCNIANGQIVFCVPHAAVEDLLNAVIYARDVITEIPFARPGHETLKNEIILPLSKGP
jgi:hypothetical protein